MGVADAETRAEAALPLLGEIKGLRLAARLAVAVRDCKSVCVGSAEGVCKALSREKALGETSEDCKADHTPESVAANGCVAISDCSGEAVSGAVGAAVVDGEDVFDASSGTPTERELERDARAGADSTTLKEAADESVGSADATADEESRAENAADGENIGGAVASVLILPVCVSE